MNSAGSSGPVTAMVQPDNVPPIIQFREPLLATSENQITRTWSNDCTSPGGSEANGFNGSLDSTPGVGTGSSGGGIVIWDTSAYPLTGNLVVYHWDEPGGTGPAQITVEDVNGDTTTYSKNVTETGNTSTDCGFNANIAKISVYRFNNTWVGGYVLNGTTVTDGQPISQGTNLIFAAEADMTPLAAGDEVTQPTEIAARTWSDELTEQGGTGPRNPQNLFDGNTFSSTESFNFNANIMWTLSGYTLTGKLKVTVGLVNGTYVVLYKDKNNNNTTKNFPGSTGYFELDVEELSYIQVKYQDFQNYTKLSAVELDGEYIIDGQPIAGGVTGTVGSIANTTVTLTEEVSGWVNGLDVVGPDKTPTRSMTDEEYVEQLVKFSTYENRRDVHQGEIAMGKREEMYKQLEAAGVDPPAINKILGGTSK